MASLILFLSLLSISSAMEKPPSVHVIRGSSTNIEYYPFQVSIKGNRTNKHLCAGSVVTEKFVITAAHCINRRGFQKNGMYKQYIFVGSTCLSGKGQIHNIEFAMYHPKFYIKHKIFDIGIIGIQDKFYFNKFVQPARILSSDIPIGTKVTVTGWGRTSYPKINRPDKLQMLHMRVISLKECKRAFGNKKNKVKDSQFCLFRNGHRGTCIGDSGGPVSLNGVLVGVISWGKSCARGKPDVNTKLSAYVKWIKTTITKYCKTRNCPDKNVYPVFVKTKQMIFCPNEWSYKE